MPKKEKKQKKQKKQPTQKQRQAQQQTVVVNVGSTRRAPAKKSSPPPQQSYYTPSFSVYPIYQQGVNVPAPVSTPVSEPTARYLGAEPKARVVGETVKIPKAIKSEKIPSATAYPAATAYPYKGQFEEYEDFGVAPEKVFTTPKKAEPRSPSPYVRPPIEPAMPAGISSSESEEETVKFSKNNFRVADARAEYRRRYGTEPPNYLREFSNRGGTANTIGLGSFLNRGLPKPPDTREEYDAWITSLGSQKR